MRCSTPGRRPSFARLTVLVSVMALFMGLAPAANAVIETDDACPNPPSAGFQDMSVYPSQVRNAADCLADYGITRGTGPAAFSPEIEVTRWQMALFLIREAKILGIDLPSGADQGFVDIGDLPVATRTAINRLVQLGISEGISPTLFAPDEPVPRWQMALFLTRLMVAADMALPSGADQGFTDIGVFPSATERAINRLAQLDITEGMGGTLFSPNGYVYRWQMALFLTRTLQAAGVTPASVITPPSGVPSGSGIITAFDFGEEFSYADSRADKEVTVETDSNDTFYVDGDKATEGPFYNEMDIGDRVSVSGTTYRLTNVDADEEYLSGPIDNPDYTDSFDIVEPITGVVLNTIIEVDGPYTVYRVDRSTVSEAAFWDDIQAGDTVSISGERTDGDADDTRTISLRNVRVVGEIGNIDVDGVGTFTVEPFAQVFDVDDADTVEIDGDLIDDADLPDEWIDNATECDEVTLRYEDGDLDLELENCRIGPFEGLATGNVEVSVSVDVDFEDDDFYDGPVEYQSAVDGIQRFIVDGVIVDEEHFEDEVTVGDRVKWTPADGEIVENSILELTNVSGLTRYEVVSIDDANDEIVVDMDQGDDSLESAPIDYTLTANVGISGADIVYEIDGEESDNLADWESDADAIASTSGGATLTISESGGDIVYNIES